MPSTPSPIEPSRYAHGDAMLLAGLRRHHTFAGAAASIPEQWEAFRRLGAIPGRVGAAAYGVMCGSVPDAGTFEYMCGVRVEAFDAVPRELGRMRVPAQRYAVFTHHGSAATLRETWASIWHEWLPRSGQRAADTPDFEVYGSGSAHDADAGVIEVWFPVAAEGEATWDAGPPPAVR